MPTELSPPNPPRTAEGDSRKKPAKGFMKRLFSLLLGWKAENGLRNPSWLRRIKTPTYQKWLIGIGTAVLLTFFISPSFQLRFKDYQAGDIATKEVKSFHDLLVEDEISTREKRAEAEKNVLSVYDYDPAPLADAERRIRSIFPTMERSASDKGSLPPDKEKTEFEASLRLSLSAKETALLERERSNASLGETTVRLVSPVLRRGMIPDRELLDPGADKGVLIRNIQTREERRVLPPVNLTDVREAKTRIRNQADLLSPTLPKDLKAIVIKIAESCLKPNLTFNKSETEDQKMKARENVSPVYFKVRRGEVILRAGERVRGEHVAKIHALRKEQEKSFISSMLFGLILMAFVILASCYQFSSKNIRKFTVSQKDLLFLSTVLVGTIVCLKIFQLITDTLGGEFFSIPSSSYPYLFPMAAGAMLVRIVINSEVAIVFSALVSYFSSALLGNQLFFFIFAFVGSLVGAHNVAQCEQRNIILKAGLRVGGINSLMILSYHLTTGNPFTVALPYDLIMGFLSGMLAAVLVLGIAPIAESLFRYTTDIKLLELANMDHPLIKDLILHAPGTYHHSIIVGSLAEAAAKSVSANPLLARVSAYYHDIGKLKKPLYFIENSSAGENRHNGLTPSMSSLILVSHVKDGLELAREHHLGGRIAHIIQQHHGTSLISYFYQKAKEQENSEIDAIEETDFRYPGPKPQTKEAGIVMLADSVEAASRALADPTPARIKSLVQRITNNIFLDGQLEECELTLKDLQKIEESFTRILTAIFHQRIDYPAAAATEAAKPGSHEDPDSKSSKTYLLRLKRDKKAGPKDLGRAGGS